MARLLGDWDPKRLETLEKKRLQAKMPEGGEMHKMLCFSY
jgi:hypothetical protein